MWWTRTRAGVERASCRRLRHSDSSHPAAADQAAHTAQKRQKRRWNETAGGNAHRPTSVTCAPDTADQGAPSTKVVRGSRAQPSHSLVKLSPCLSFCRAQNSRRCPRRKCLRRQVSSFRCKLPCKLKQWGWGQQSPEWTHPLVAALVPLLPPKQGVLAADHDRLRARQVAASAEPRSYRRICWGACTCLAAWAAGGQHALSRALCSHHHRAHQLYMYHTTPLYGPPACHEDVRARSTALQLLDRPVGAPARHRRSPRLPRRAGRRGPPPCCR